MGKRGPKPKPRTFKYLTSRAGGNNKLYNDNRKKRKEQILGFGVFLRTVRKSRRMGKEHNFRQMTQEDLGNMVGLHMTYISMIESYNMLPSIAALRKLAVALNIDEDQMLLRAGRPSLATQVVMTRYPALFQAFIKLFGENPEFRAELGLLMDRIGATTVDARKGEIVERVKLLREYASQIPYRADSIRQTRFHETLKTLCAYVANDVWAHTGEYLRQAEYWKTQLEAELEAEEKQKEALTHDPVLDSSQNNQ